MSDVCNAILRRGSKQFVCGENTGHARTLGTPHRDHRPGRYPDETVTWTDSPIGGETPREF